MLKNVEHVKLSNGTLFNISGSYVIRAGKRIFLTQAELKLLEFLVSNSNKRVYLNEIIAHFSQYSFYTTEQNIYVYVNKLRKKIELDPKDPKILLNLKPGYFLNFEYN